MDYTKLDKEAQAYAENVVKAARESFIYDLADVLLDIQLAYKAGANRDKYCSATWREQQATSAAIESALAAGLADIDCLPYLERQSTSQGHRV
jgi:hypothetical protein